MLRRIAPRSLWGRTILIVVLPIFLMQAVVTYVFFARHWEDVTGALTRQTASEIGHILRMWEDPPGDLSRADVERMARRDLQLFMRWAPGETIPERNKLSFFEAPNRTLQRELDEVIPEPKWINTRGYADEIEIRVQLAGGYLVFVTPRSQVAAQNGHLFVLWLIGTSLLLGYVAIVFMRNQVRSITRLSRAAEAFGRGDEMPDFRPSGAREVRQAGRAFLAMRSRIRRYVHQRTEMLAGVSHDLRTPLTRMKLALAMMGESDDRDALQADLLEMERMLDAYLDFVRGAQDMDRELMDVEDLARELAEDERRMGGHLDLFVEEELALHGSRIALKRALSNLVGNASRHAKQVRLCAERQGTSILLHVDDDGPGIPPGERERALQPFERLDTSRTGSGTGLGLAIVADIAKRHGGSLELSEAPGLGGLRATLNLPG
ncbi:MAG: ATP-binding protein [Parvularcula sp.]|jgi:two-component system osmolarity sensor histidine kinase EnvZ|nr:ATP-binding protein [Parvularcula sp.]